MCDSFSGSFSSGFVVKVNLADRQIVGGAPVSVDLLEQFGSERVGAHGELPIVHRCGFLVERFRCDCVGFHELGLFSSTSPFSNPTEASFRQVDL